MRKIYRRDNDTFEIKEYRDEQHNDGNAETADIYQNK